MTWIFFPSFVCFHMVLLNSTPLHIHYNRTTPHPIHMCVRCAHICGCAHKHTHAQVDIMDLWVLLKNKICL